MKITSKRGEQLEELCKSYIDDKIDVLSYRELFNSFYITYEDEMDEEELSRFDGVYIANELYAIDVKNRNTNENYIDIEQLKSIIHNVIDDNT